MLKMIYRKFNNKKDYRFLDAELYRKQVKSKQDDVPFFQLSEREALRVDFCSVTERSNGSDLSFINHYYKSKQRLAPEDDFITVNPAPEKQFPAEFKYTSFTTRARKFEINDIDYDRLSKPVNKVDYLSSLDSGRSFLSIIADSVKGVPKLGVFSDNKPYSSFVRAELSKLRVDVQHFNHPSTFNASNFTQLDKIDAWIVFLSDDSDGEFLDAFIDRYIDKPTLFLVPKAKRKTATHTIREFIESLG